MKTIITIDNKSLERDAYRTLQFGVIYLKNSKPDMLSQ